MSELRLPSEHTCIVLLSGIGDVVNGLPLVNALKQDDPDRHITWVVQSEPAPILRGHRAVDRVVTFDRVRGLREVAAVRRKLRPLRFDLVLNLNIYFKAAVPTFFARAPHKVSFGRDRARDLVWLFANHHLPPGPTAHRVDMYLEFATFLDLTPDRVAWRMALTEDERAAQREFFSRVDGRAVAGIVATAGRPEKDWPTERFGRLATALDRDFGVRVVLLGGPGRREAARAQEIGRGADGTPIQALGDDLRRLIYLIDGCDFIIAPDTGPVHIARALETPVIGLYGHTDPRLHGPYRAYEDLTIDRFNYDAPGVPAITGAGRPKSGRMPMISVKNVLEKVEHALGNYVRRVGPASGLR